MSWRMCVILSVLLLFQVLSVGAPKSRASSARSKQRSYKAPPAPTPPRTLEPTPIPDLPRKPITTEGRLPAEEIGFLVELERLYKRFRPVPEAVNEMIERGDELVKYFKDRNAEAAEIANEIQKIAKNLVVEKGPFGKDQLVPYTNFLLTSTKKNHYAVQVIKQGPEEYRGFYTRQIEVLQQIEKEILLELKGKLRPLRSLSKQLDVYF